MKRILPYFISFAMTVVICLSLLLIATFAPQVWVDENIVASVEQLAHEGAYIAVWDWQDSAVLDNYTDALILMESKAMVQDSKSTVLTNPLYVYGDDDPVTALREYAYGYKFTPSSYYTRYWMGFRAIVRWLLVFLDYFQIRRYVGVTLYVMFFTLMFAISKRLGYRQAMVFALSVLVVRPQVICSSLQYSCCFLIAFLAMLLVPWIHKNPKFRGLFFMELGMLTMYFDFYTTPLITYGMPMVYLCLLLANENGTIKILTILKEVGIWLTGYMGIWVSKLILTDLLTDESSIMDALAVVCYRLGFSAERVSKGEEYSIMRALQRVWEIVLPDVIANVLFIVFVFSLTAWIVHKWRKKEINSVQVKNSSAILLIAVLPIIWFCVTAQPIIHHAMFQYRSIVLLIWAVAAYLCLITEKPLQNKVLEKTIET